MASGDSTWGDARFSPELKASFRWAFLGLGGGLVGIAIQLASSSASLSALTLAAGIIGVLTSAVAVVRHPRNSRILAIAALTALAGLFATDPSWGSIRLAFGVAAGVAGVTSILFVLPRTARLAVVSVLVLYHFAGVMSAITSPPPTPWLTSQTWVRFFRPHLEFCYVNNA